MQLKIGGQTVTERDIRIVATRKPPARTSGQIFTCGGSLILCHQIHNRSNIESIAASDILPVY